MFTNLKNLMESLVSFPYFLLYNEVRKDEGDKAMKKKMIAPIVIGILIGMYFITWISMVYWLSLGGMMAFLITLPMIALLFLWVYVVKERIDEIRSGEEDDLSKY